MQQKKVIKLILNCFPNTEEVLSHSTQIQNLQVTKMTTLPLGKWLRSPGWRSCIPAQERLAGTRTSSGSGAGVTSCRQRWWRDSEHTRAWCSRHTGQRGCDTEERYLGKSKEGISKLKTDRSGHLFQSTTYAKTSDSLIQKESESYLHPLRAKNNFQHAQSGSFKHNNKKSWLPRNMDYSTWQTR